MQRLFFYWINYTLLILFIVMVILGVVQLAVKKESEITFIQLFWHHFGISFMSAYYANKKSNRMFFWLTTFLLMYVPKKIVDYLNVPLLKISVANYFIVLFGILILIFPKNILKNKRKKKWSRLCIVICSISFYLYQDK